MNTVNLLSIYSLFKSQDVNLDLVKKYITSTGNPILKDNEILDLKKLLIHIFTTLKNQKIPVNNNVFNGFFMGYKIPNIGKEFDLLRFGCENIINIELKNASTLEKTLIQLERNKYYLEFLGKDLELYSYVSGEEKIYKLDNDKLVEITFSDLIYKLLNQELEFCYSDYNININSKFDLKNYLVSPFNSPKRFVRGEYFLTNAQEQIKNIILKEFLSQCTQKNYIMGIKGNPGTGKTLLIYDIALEFIKKSYDVLIVHSANLNSGHFELKNSFGINIIPIKAFNNMRSLSNYDLVIVDEAQRINTDQFNKFIKLSKQSNISILFSFDPRQCLSIREINTRFEDLLNKQLTTKLFVLSDKIRTNPELAQFVRCLFDRNQLREHKGISLIRNHVRVEYFDSTSKVLYHLKYLTRNGWKFLNSTSSTIYKEYPDKYSSIDHEVSHAVIGQEFDNVVIVLNKYNYIDETGLLQGRGTYYHPNGMIFQNITRAINNLCIIIDKDVDMYNHCVNIVNFFDN